MEEQTLAEKELNDDLEYIDNEIIAMCPKPAEISEYQDPDEVYKYVKFSRALNAVAVINLTKKQYVNYWKTIYKDDLEEWKTILNAINKKFDTGLISAKEMINLIKKSSDYESEKKSAIKALKGEK